MSPRWITRRARAQRALQDFYEVLGWQGLVGVVLACGAIAAYFMLVRPEMTRVASLSAELARLTKRAPSTAAPAAQPTSPRASQAEFYSLFPPSNRASQVLEKIVEAAEREGLKLEQGEYRFARDTGGELVQLHIALPVKGSYAQVRKFIAAALAAAPSLALEGVLLERDKIGDTVIEARIRMLAFLREER
jgi:hypothetical protein